MLLQVKVPCRMLDPDGGDNAVMQLNLGEGKTSVILPMLAATISYQEKRVARVTVLRSTFPSNEADMRNKLGGLLGLRVYVIPCRRDYKIEEKDIRELAQTYTECLLARGVVMAMPEHRLSFELKTLELARKGSVSASEMLKVLQWGADHFRDVLDEVDELLSVRYQLIYTVGSQVELDGNDTRWAVAALILKSVRKHMPAVFAQHGDTFFEYSGHPKHEFPASCRLLTSASCPAHKDHVFCSLATRVAADIADVLKLPLDPDGKRSHADVKLRRAMLDPLLPKGDLDLALSLVAIDKRATVLTARGYLAFGVLQTALRKRWRVEYGVHPRGPRLMAVPFRAKDVAAERTEFAHADLAIVLTMLHYCRSGLSNKQLVVALERLAKSDRAAAIYSS